MSRILRVGIIGMGYIGRSHYAALQHIPDVEVAAAAGPRVSEIRKAYPQLRVFSTWGEMLRDCPLDAVIVAVPTFLHAECVTDAATAGCDILCEKPLALDAASAEKMIEATEGHAVILMVGQVLRFWPHYCRIKELIARGGLGAIQSISAYRLSKFPPGAPGLPILKRAADACSIFRCTMSISFTGSGANPSRFAHAASARRRGAGIMCGQPWSIQNALRT